MPFVLCWKYWHVQSSMEGLQLQQSNIPSQFCRASQNQAPLDRLRPVCIFALI